MKNADYEDFLLMKWAWIPGLIGSILMIMMIGVIEIRQPSLNSMTVSLLSGTLTILIFTSINYTDSRIHALKKRISKLEELIDDKKQEPGSPN